VAKQRYATCACEGCYIRLPKNEAYYDDVTVEIGGWEGSSEGSYSGSGRRSSKNNYGWSSYGSTRSSSSSRIHYRNRRLWYCFDCYNNLLEARVKAEEEREERERQEKKRRQEAKEQRRPFVIFLWLCIITFVIALFAKP
jgi:hypothetical protein